MKDLNASSPCESIPSKGFFEDLLGMAIGQRNCSKLVWPNGYRIPVCWTTFPLQVHFHWSCWPQRCPLRFRPTDVAIPPMWPISPEQENMLFLYALWLEPLEQKHIVYVWAIWTLLLVWSILPIIQCFSSPSWAMFGRSQGSSRILRIRIRNQTRFLVPTKNFSSDLF